MPDERDVRVDPATRRAAIIYDLRTRLAAACKEWPPELFDAMVDGLADITLKYEGHASPSTYDRRTTDRLVADLKEALERNEEGRDRKDSGGR